MRFSIAGAVIMSAWCVLPTNAYAELRFCNHTGVNANVSIAYFEKDAEGTTTNGHQGGTSEGWWILGPGECQKASGIRVGNYWVYYHAYSTKGTWAGTHYLCVPAAVFTRSTQFRQAGSACGSGDRLRGFRLIETNAGTYTMTLN